MLLVPAHTAPYKAGGERGSGGRGGGDRPGGRDARGGQDGLGGSDAPDGRDPGPQHRLRMCELAVRDHAGLSVCAIEVERGGLSYTVDTLSTLHHSHPQAQLTFIVGADTAATLGSWREPARLLELADLAVAARAPSGAHPARGAHAGTERRRVLDVVAAIGADARRVRFLEMPEIDVSSSLVRRRVGAGEDVEQLVGPAVARYIAEHALYRERAEALA